MPLQLRPLGAGGASHFREDLLYPVLFWVLLILFSFFLVNWRAAFPLGSKDTFVSFYLRTAPCLKVICIYLVIYLFIYLFIYSFVCLFIYLLINLFIYLLYYVFICLFIYYYYFFFFWGGGEGGLGSIPSQEIFPGVDAATIICIPLLNELSGESWLNFCHIVTYLITAFHVRMHTIENLKENLYNTYTKSKLWFHIRKGY